MLSDLNNETRLRTIWQLWSTKLVEEIAVVTATMFIERFAKIIV